MNKVNKELKEFHRICSKYLVRDGLTNCYKTPAYDNYLGNVRVAEWSKLNSIRVAYYAKFGNDVYNLSWPYTLCWHPHTSDLEKVEQEISELIEFVKNETVNIKKRRLERDFV